MTYHVGFTGAREGMSERQRTQLRFVLRLLGPDVVLHDGDGPGADQEAHALALEFGLGCHRHPPRAHTAKELLRRNETLVYSVALLIAAPRQDVEEVRSGTWATIRYARTAGLPIIMLPRGDDQKPDVSRRLFGRRHP